MALVPFSFGCAAGHLVFFAHSGSCSGFELGILFHAKEHPVEFTNRVGPMLAVCSPETGGARDPRRGTKLSIASPGFSDRNFLWLLSLNSTFRVRVPSSKEEGASAVPLAASLAWELLAPGAAGSRFFTIDESHFGLQLGSLCYLPKGHDPALPIQRQAHKAQTRMDALRLPPAYSRLCGEYFVGSKSTSRTMQCFCTNRTLQRERESGGGGGGGGEEEEEEEKEVEVEVAGGGGGGGGGEGGKRRGITPTPGGGRLLS